MPFYEYECQVCSERFEAMLPMSARDSAAKELACPACGAHEARRLISTFATPASAAGGDAAFPCGADQPCAGST
jgi:putative FmdB family regulatory protein